MKYIGLLSSDARGKNGGNVASRNRYGTYLRRHVAPVQPRSPSQLANRQMFGSISSSWRNLTAAEQAGWNTLASTVVFKDQLGSPYNPTGAQLFMLMSRNLIEAGGTSYATSPAALPSIPAIETLTPTFAYGYSTASVAITSGGTGYASSGSFTVTYATGSQAGGTYTATSGAITTLTLSYYGSGQTGSGTFAFTGGGTGATATATLGTTPQPELSVAYAPTPVPTGVNLFVYASKALSVGTTFKSKGQFRLLTVLAAGAASSYNAGSDYLKVFGLAPTHGSLQVKAKFVDATTGYPGADITGAVSW